MLNAEFDLAMESVDRRRSSYPNKSATNRPFVDRALLSVIHRGKSCFLGNTLLLRLIERLLRSLNQYVSHQQLQEEVWDANG